MITAIVTLLSVVWVVLAFVTVSLCFIAGEADRRAEIAYREQRAA